MAQRDQCKVTDAVRSHVACRPLADCMCCKPCPTSDMALLKAKAEQLPQLLPWVRACAAQAPAGGRGPSLGRYAPMPPMAPPALWRSTKMQ